MERKMMNLIRRADEIYLSFGAPEEKERGPRTGNRYLQSKKFGVTVFLARAKLGYNDAFC